MAEHQEQRALSRMRAMIEDGDYPLNSRLPPERSLCETMGVTRAALRKALATLEAEGQIWRHVGKGTFYLWLPVPKGMSSIEFTTRLLEDAHVLVTAGSAFGQHGEGYFRMSLTVSDDRLACALERMKRTVN